MASNQNRAQAKDAIHDLLASEAVHEIVETGHDLLKPVNENPTNSSIPNPFVLARAQFLRRREAAGQNAETQAGS